MDELFSCRNCIHNCGQSLHVGQGHGYCLQHGSVLKSPASTTCKYLHRKDLPTFLVDEGIREHAAEFAGFPALVSMVTRKPVRSVPYSELYCWNQLSFDPITHALAQYYKAGRSWVFIQAMYGDLDGRRALVYSSAVRRYMNRCGTWKSSYRLVLALVNGIDVEPVFEPRELVGYKGQGPSDAADTGRWDVIFARLAALQEYGWHAAIEEFTWAPDSLNGALSDLDWHGLLPDLAKAKKKWTALLIRHAKRERVYFEPGETSPEDPFSQGP